MPRVSPFTSLERSLTRLAAERQMHMEALARIDALFSKFGISGAAAAPANIAVAAPLKVGRKSRRRRRFGQTAEEFVLDLLGSKSMITGDINNAWVAAGRSGKADNTLSILTKKKIVKRNPLKDGRGSTYSVA